MQRARGGDEGAGATALVADLGDGLRLARDGLVAERDLEDRRARLLAGVRVALGDRERHHDRERRGGEGAAGDHLLSLSLPRTSTEPA
jgi:hypothetical protein